LLQNNEIGISWLGISQKETFSVLIWQTIFVIWTYAYPWQSLSRICFFFSAVTLKYFIIYKSCNTSRSYFFNHKKTGTFFSMPLCLSWTVTVQDRHTYSNTYLCNVLKANKGATSPIYTHAINIFLFCNNRCMCAYPGQWACPTVQDRLMDKNCIFKKNDLCFYVPMR
jgi:hypothetical protein